MTFLNIGFGNLSNYEKVIAIISPESAPVRRIISEAKKNGNLIDATQGRKTRAVIIMENHDIILSAVMPETIIARNVKGDKNE
ncbi:MAG: extracellular matrix/biofilm biosynthesis regulator RemA family protein [Eubacteriaceae bacterium]